MSFTIRNINITFYSIGIFIILGFIFFNLSVIKLAIYKYKNPKFWFDNIILLSIVTVIGARSAFVLQNLDRFTNNMHSIFLPDGFSFYGGALAFVIALFIMNINNIKNMIIWLDIFSASFFIWLFFSYIGHFLDGSNYGVPTDLPLGVIYRSIDTPVPYTIPIHPTQLYYAIFGIIVFIFLYWIIKNNRMQHGKITLFSIFAIAIADFCLQFLVDDKIILYWNLSLSQMIDIALIIIASLLLFFFSDIKAKFLETYPD